MGLDAHNLEELDARKRRYGENRKKITPPRSIWSMVSISFKID
jgi:hypothetical protein